MTAKAHDRPTGTAVAGAALAFRFNLPNEVRMDTVFIGAIVLFLALTWGMASGCAQLGERT